MRGTHSELDVFRRGVVHALEQVGEDAERWCASLTDAEIHASRPGLPSVAFHLRHLVRSLDRLLTYAADQSLDEIQLAALASEKETAASSMDVMNEFRAGIRQRIERIGGISPESYEQPRGIGRKRLPTTVGGLLLHCAEHSQRHIGQAITTAKQVRL